MQVKTGKSRKYSKKHVQKLKHDLKQELKDENAKKIVTKEVYIAKTTYCEQKIKMIFKGI